jgi:tetratricopeptide (TPR) repeat protein
MTISKYLSIAAIVFALTIPRGEAKETGDASSNHNNKGVELAQQHQYEEAIKEFNLAIQANPKNAKAYVNRGSIFRAMHAQARISNTMMRSRILPKQSKSPPRIRPDIWNAGRRWSCKKNIPTH